jgi:hypothetical protein
LEENFHICFELQSDGNSDATKANEAKTKTKMKTNKQNKTKQDKTRKPNLDHSSCVSQAVSCNIISKHQRLHGLLISCSEFFLLRQYFTHLISLFFLLSIVVNNQPIPQAKRNFKKEKKTKKIATKLTEPALSNLTSSSKTTTKKKKKQTNKQTKEQKKKRKKRARAHTHTQIKTTEQNKPIKQTAAGTIRSSSTKLQTQRQTDKYRKQKQRIRHRHRLDEVLSEVRDNFRKIPAIFWGKEREFKYIFFVFILLIFLHLKFKHSKIAKLFLILLNFLIKNCSLFNNSCTLSLNISKLPKYF